MLVSKFAKPNDPLWCKVVLRRISVPLVHVLHKNGIDANSVSIFGTLLAICSSFLIACGNASSCLTGAVLFNVVAITDCVDGSLARINKKTGPIGEWYDAQMGYTVYGVLPLALLFNLLYSDTYDSSIFSLNLVLFSCGVWGVGNLYIRILYQKYTVTLLQIGAEAEPGFRQKKSSLAQSMLSEIGLVGWQMPILLICIYNNWIDFYVMFYAMIYVVICVVSAFMILSRINKLKSAMYK